MTVRVKRNQCLHPQVAAVQETVVMAKAVNALTRAAWVTKRVVALTAVIAETDTILVQSAVPDWAMRHSELSAMHWSMQKWPYVNWPLKPMANR
jgi:hypothetical protein